ncbi:MAG: hypothetical protein EBQ57_01825 [Actinobacteria bacterium]|nr:hypothetical protein [Actinomycetota bacterium]
MNEYVRLISVRPLASDEEVAAISAAIVTLWPTPEPTRHTSRDSTWRFSGRPKVGSIASGNS